MRPDSADTKSGMQVSEHIDGGPKPDNEGCAKLCQIVSQFKKTILEKGLLPQ